MALLYQAVLALFIDEGHFERHLRRMRKVYERRRAALLEAFETNFGSRARVLGTDSGMHVLVHIEGVRDARAFVDRARERSVGIYSAHGYYSGEPPRGATFLMGYSSVGEDGIREGIRAPGGNRGRLGRLGAATQARCCYAARWNAITAAISNTPCSIPPDASSHSPAARSRACTARPTIRLKTKRPAPR